MDELMRLFVAINFSEEIKTSLYQTIEELKKHSVQGSFTQKENIHLTLAFIGETKELDHIKQAMHKVALDDNIMQFQLLLNEIGKFKRRDGDIYWIGVKQNQILSDLNKNLVQELKNFINNIKDENFKPHLTLGRRVRVNDNFNISEFKKTLSLPVINVDRISLMKSERIQGRLVYTEIYHCNLV